MLEVLNMLRGVYNRAFTPLQANVPNFYPLSSSGCVFREHKIGILARDGLTLDGISNTVGY